MSKVYSVPTGTFHVGERARLRVGTKGRRMQGGLPPVAYRSATPKWVSGNARSREPIARVYMERPKARG